MLIYVVPLFRSFFKITGLFNIKLGLALILAGGSQRVDDTGTTVRGDSHMLIVGDSGIWIIYKKKVLYL